MSSAKRNGMQLVCVVINSPQMFERSSKLLNNSFSEYEYKCVFDNKKLEKDCSLFDFTLISSKNSFYYPLSKTEKVKIKYETFNNFDFPIKKGKEICKVDIFSQNKLIFSEKIYTINSIKNKKTLDCIKEKIKSYFSENYEN